MSAAKELYEKKIKKQIMEEMNYKNHFQVPKLEKIVLNMASGEVAHDSKKLQSLVEDLTVISGQKPVITKAKKSIASFKIRENMNIGAKVTLRKNRMYEFVDRLVNIALPRIRDFRGLSKRSFDGKGNYSLGIKEQIIFPEINYDKVDKIRGMDITICTSAEDDCVALKLLQAFNFPIK